MVKSISGADLALYSPPGLPIDFALASIIEANWSFSALIFMESYGF
jgi:hypothetical protein